MKTPTIIKQLTKTKLRIGIFSSLPILAFLSFIMLSTSPAVGATSGDCTAPSPSYGTDTMYVEQPSTTSYTVWARVQTPSVPTSTPLELQIGTGTSGSSPSCWGVGSSTTITTANSWTWVNVTGSTPISLTAYSSSSANQTQLELFGAQAGVEVDNVLLLADSTCTPTGTGTNCTTGQTTPSPTTPTDLVATATADNNVNLSWKPSSDSGGPGVAGYTITRTTVSSGTITTFNVPGANTDTYSDASVTASTAYTYAINSYDSSSPALTSPLSPTVSVTTPAAPVVKPSTPTNFKATVASDSAIDLSWTASNDSGGPGLGGYTITRTTVSTKATATFTVNSATATSYTDTSVSPNTSYTYTIEAFDTAGNDSQPSSPTPTVTTPVAYPTTPTQVTASATAYNNVNVSWAGSTDPDGPGLGGYYVMRSTDGAALVTIGQVAAGTTTYADSSVTASTQYSYTIEAFDTTGNDSQPSNASPTVTTPAAPVVSLSAPVLSATAVSSSQINLSWTPSAASNTSVAGYTVYEIAAGAVSQITGITTTTFGASELSPSTEYSFYVVAYDAKGDKSPASATVDATTLAAPATTVTVEGIVSSSTTNTPLVGAEVRTGDIATANGEEITTTNSTGGYLLTNIIANRRHDYFYSLKGYTIVHIVVGHPAGTFVQNESLIAK